MEPSSAGFSDAPLTIDTCISSSVLPSNDSVVAVGMETNESAAEEVLKRKLCEILLANAVRPTHDPHRNARQMLTFLLMGVAGMTVAFFGLIGNLLSAIVLTRRTMKTSTYCYLAALAICDLLVVGCTLILLIKDANPPAPEATSWPLSDQGSFYPYVFPYLHPAAITFQVTSVWLTLAFTVDRYIMICHPFKSEPFCTVSRARKVIVSLVLASIAFNLPKFFEYRTVVVRPPLAAVRLSGAEDMAVVGSDLTEFGNSRAFKQLYHSWFYILFVFGIPFLSLVVLNGFLVDAVRKARQRSCDFRPPTHGIAMNASSCPAYQLEEVASVRSSTRSLTDLVGYQLEELTTPVPRPASPVGRRIDTTVMLIGVVVIFIVCQLPALVSRTIWAFVDNPSRAFTDLPLYALNETANFLVLLNSSVNIVPYYFFGRRFRRQFLALFCPYCETGRSVGRARDRCDSAVDSAVFLSHSAGHPRDDVAVNHHRM